MKIRKGSRDRISEHGISLLETLIAAVVLIIGIGGVMSLFAVGASKNVSQGTQASRCTEYAQDKMEQLMALQFNDTTSDTRNIITAASGGSGLAPGGVPYPNSPAANIPTAGSLYFDYISEVPGSGAVISTSASGASYLRQWTIVANATDSNIVTITVWVKSLQSTDSGGVSGSAASLAPMTTLVSMKTNF